MSSKPDFVPERNVMIKQATKTFGFIFPSTYHIGMSGMTVAVLSDIVNSLPNWQFERFFVPWNPNVEATSIEHQLSLSQVDVIGFTTQYEVDYLALGWFLKRARIPIDNLKRKKGEGKYPPLVIGGPCSLANPLPLMDIADGFFLGDAELSLPAFLNKIDTIGKANFWNEIDSFQAISGFWSPHFLDLNEKDFYSSLFTNKRFEDIAGEWHSKVQFVNLNEISYPLTQIVTELPDYHGYAPFKRQSFQLEIGRGCDHGCRFCMISQLLQKGRFRSYQKLLEILEGGMKRTQVNTVDVFGTNLSEFPRLEDLCWDIVNLGYKISLATLRPDRVTSDLVEALQKGGQKSITIAVETGTERLRRTIGKPMSDDRIFHAVQLISEAKIPNLKNFFLIGLPTETEQDRQTLVNMVVEEKKIFCKSQVEKTLIKVDVNPFIPKWHTPFKNYLYHYIPDNRKEFKNIIVELYKKFDAMAGIKPKHAPLSYSLAQTWLTHLKSPINFILEQVPLKNSAFSFFYAPFFIARFEDRFDSVLMDQWTEFVRSDWKITHPIRATCHDDEWFTKEYKKVNIHKKH